MPVPLAVSLAVDPAFDDCAEPRVVLFRALPEELEEQARIDLVELAGPPFPVGVAGVLPLPDGVALGLVSPELTRRHRELQLRWWPSLPATDRRPLRAHVVVARGLSPVAARSLLTVRRRQFRREQVRAAGFVLWQAADEWTELAHVPFGERA